MKHKTCSANSGSVAKTLFEFHGIPTNRIGFRRLRTQPGPGCLKSAARMLPGACAAYKFGQCIKTGGTASQTSKEAHKHVCGRGQDRRCMPVSPCSFQPIHHTQPAFVRASDLIWGFSALRLGGWVAQTAYQFSLPLQPSHEKDPPLPQAAMPWKAGYHDCEGRRRRVRD